MKLLPLILTMLFLAVLNANCLAQKIVVGAKSELGITVGSNTPVGAKKYGGEPALLANMKGGKSIALNYVISCYKNIYVGCWGGYTSFEGWNEPSTLLYDGSSITFVSIGPSLMFKNWSPGHLLSNKLNFFVELSPNLSKVSVRTSPDSKVNVNSENNPLTVQSVRFTMRINAGVSYILSNSFTANFSLGYQSTQAKSHIFSEKNYAFLNFNAGLSYRMFKDKRFKYSGL